jgi:hypothetical protein
METTRICPICKINHIKLKKHKTCSRQCGGILMHIRRGTHVEASLTRNCEHCGKPTINKRFCSLRCFHDSHIEDHIKKWLDGELNGSRQGGGTIPRVRRFLLKEANYACSKCGWNKRHPVGEQPLVQIDHIDGDPLNGKRNNLRVLCPNCHSETETHGSRNSSNPLRIAARKATGRHIRVFD